MEYTTTTTATVTTTPRQTLIEDHLDVARQVAMKLWRRVRDRGFALDEVVAEAYLGLVRAVDKYDPARNTGLGTWVKFKVETYLLDWLREQSPLTVAHARMVARGKVRPVATVPIHRWQDAERGNPSACVAPKQADPTTDHREPPPDGRLTTFDLLRFARRCLNKRERLAVLLYYGEELTMAEVGAVLGLSESRVSQTLGRALREMREWVASRGYGAVARPAAVAEGVTA